jgi:hypothetical protein
VLVCKEDRELVTKSQCVVFSNIFRLLNLALGRIQLQGQDAKLEGWMRECLVGLPRGPSGTVVAALPEGLSEPEQRYFAEVAVYIVLVPQVFKLQLLVEDRELETSLRREALQYLERRCELVGARQQAQGCPEEGLLHSLVS